ncbi:LysM domain-containing protein [Nocardioides aestuarii]
MAHHRHKRDTDARPTRFTLPRARYVAGGLAVMATVASVGTGVLVAAPESPTLQAASSPTSAAGSISTTVDISDRAPVVSRSSNRIDRESKVDRMLTAEATEKAVRGADTHRWATTELNLWTTPEEKTSEKVGLLKSGKKVLVTGRTALDRVEVVVDGDSLWVTAGYLAEEKPEPEPEDVGLGGACTNGTSVDGQPNVIGVHEAVCAAFPEITSYGTYRGDGEHSQGLAIDIMVSGATGWDVAEFVRAHYQELGVNYVIYSQKIWSVDRSSEGWRPMEDRGSVTANHYDHVHVTTY